MILYFSGTGNSAYTATKLGALLGEEPRNLFESIREQEYGELYSPTPWVIVTPTYAWRIPRLLQDYLEKTPLSGSKDVYFVMTCGSDIGNAGAYARKFCASKGLRHRGCIPVVMPENYIALFRAPSPEESRQILQRAKPAIQEAARLIQKREAYPRERLTLKDRLKSGPVNKIFYPAIVHAKKFTVSDACISCGRCAALCPLKNIRMENGRPRWDDRCTHCMACICRCPKEAIEYGRNSRGQYRYTCPKE